MPGVAEKPVRRMEIESALRRLFRSDAVQAASWSSQRLPYLQYRPGRDIQRVMGMAVVSGRTVRWSAVVKRLGDPGSGPRAAEAAQGARRELQAYTSGLLDGGLVGIVAPRLLGLFQHPDGTALWLEDVADAYGGRWPLSRFRLAACHLGQFNGAYLVRRAVPADPWLSLDWAHAQSDPAAARLASERIATAWAQPVVRAMLPATLDAPLQRLLHDQESFVGALERLPITLCHHDAAQANLVARRSSNGVEETVALDWEEIGPGAIGAEIATLVFGSLRRGDLDVEQTDHLDRLVFGGYLDGLRDAGWSGDPRLARFGYAAAVALRWYLPTGLIRTVVEDPLRTTVVEATGLPLDEFVRRRLALTDFLLARADEARQLGEQLGLL
ncbi:MAG: hypothetical protein U0893_24020 [Chloroflexota bacterium]